ncbi:hypothetical protein [Mobilicoccus pelagius]|uniref:Uncharacterized protein n=1 Tax=Mobilicoccus pelagius NBRC 104925 TaxID=1089455 RepID=H5UMK6_9MICO|nr:hypothetical protein [Mobilicoccus pelagius]GAB46964.1 hypothetical protein MOPEL_001_00840 [Mobilicoccus pelagius NBRC 104925]
MDADRTGHLRGAAMAERIREALEDTFEREVRDGLHAGRTLPGDRLHDYLTGVADHHEPRVRLLFELVEDGTFDPLTCVDVPATCFFLGDSVRYQRALADWVRLLGPSGPYAALDPAGPSRPLDLWSAGDLLWRADRDQAEASRDYLTLLLDRPVGLWHTRVDPAELEVLAVDVWSGRHAHRVVVAPGVLDAERVLDGDDVPLDRPVSPRPRIDAGDRPETGDRPDLPD